MAKANGLGAFDAIAKKEPEKKKSATSKVAAEVTDVVKTAVDIYTKHKAEIKRLEAEQAAAYDTIISHVKPQQAALARKGTYTKSFTVVGHVSAVTFTTSDSFSLPKDQGSQEALKGVLKQRFGEWIESKRTIKVRDEAQTNEVFINKLVAACKAAGLEMAEAFEVFDTLVAKDDLDRKQFELTDKEYAEFATLAKQKAPSLKA